MQRNWEGSGEIEENKYKTAGEMEVFMCVCFSGIEKGRCGMRESVTRENARDIRQERGRDIEILMMKMMMHHQHS